MTGPLSGIRVFDMTVAMNGPFASMLLGSLGADVLRIDQPDVDWQQLGAGVPPSIRGTSSNYIACNMNKRGVFIDLKDEDDRAFAHELVATCDVLMTNMRTGVPERLGMGYEELKEINPRLIYCVATAYGREGPMANAAGVDGAIQALTGSMTAQGARGEPGQTNRHHTQMDISTSNSMVQGVLLALYARKRTGKGQLIEITMLDAAATLQTPRFGEHFDGIAHEPRGSSSYVTAPDHAFVCRDQSWVGVSISSEDEWRSFCAVAGCSELFDDPRFASNHGRMENRVALEALLEPVFAEYPQAYWIITLEKANIPCAPTMNWDLRDHAQVRANDFLIEVETDVWGTIWTGGPPWQFSKTPAQYFSAPIPGINTYELKDEIAERKAEAS